jgi:hypothetical protein
MRMARTNFSSQVELPCTVSCGERGVRKIAGTVFQIESGRLLLRLTRAKHMLLCLGEEVRIDVHLPAEAGIAEKDLTIRGRVSEITELEHFLDYVLMFRRAQFRDRHQSHVPGSAFEAGLEM